MTTGEDRTCAFSVGVSKKLCAFLAFLKKGRLWADVVPSTTTSLCVASSDLSARFRRIAGGTGLRVYHHFDCLWKRSSRFLVLE